MAKLQTHLPTCITNLNPLPGLVDDTELLDTYRAVLENILRLPNGTVDTDMNVVMMGVQPIKPTKQSYTVPSEHAYNVFKNYSMGDMCYWSIGWKSLDTAGCRDVIRSMVSQQALPQLLCTRESLHVWDAMEPWLDQLYRFAFGRHVIKRACYVPRSKLAATTRAKPEKPAGELVSLMDFKARQLEQGLEE